MILIYLSSTRDRALLAPRDHGPLANIYGTRVPEERHMSGDACVCVAVLIPRNRRGDGSAGLAPQLGGANPAPRNHARGPCRRFMLLMPSVYCFFPRNLLLAKEPGKKKDSHKQCWYFGGRWSQLWEGYWRRRYGCCPEIMMRSAHGR